MSARSPCVSRYPAPASLRAGVDLAGKVAEAFEPGGRVGRAERQDAGQRLDEADQHEGERERRRPQRGAGEAAGEGRRASRPGDPVAGKQGRGGKQRREPVALHAIVQGVDEEVGRRRSDRADQQSTALRRREPGATGFRQETPTIAAISAANASGFISRIWATTNSTTK